MDYIFYRSVAITKIFLFSKLTVGLQSYWTSSTVERMGKRLLQVNGLLCVG